VIQQIVGRIPAAPLENGIFSCHTEQLWPPYLCAQYGVYMVGAAWDWRDGSVFVAPLVSDVGAVRRHDGGTAPVEQGGVF
jgi:hypothetical protein